MPRQLRNKGGIMTIGGGGYTGIPMGSRTGFGIVSKLKDRVRKLIPNELASVAVKAAPFVAPFSPKTAALMRGIGRFDQRGSLSDALKQGAATFAFGAGARKLGGAPDVFGDFSLSSPLDPERTQGFTSLFDKQQATQLSDVEKAEQGLNISKEGILPAARDLAKAGIKKLPEGVVAQLVAGGLTAGASLLASYFQGDFREQEPGETMEEYLERRREYVGTQMRTYMDNYFANDPEYMKLDDAGRDAFVARYNIRDGGRVGYQTGGITMANTLAENIARNRAAQAAFEQSIAPARERVKEQIRKRTPVQEYAMGEDSILGPLSKKAASTIIEGQDRSRDALDVLNQTMAPTSAGEAGGIITDGPNKFRINADGSRTIIGSVGEGIMTQAPTTDTTQNLGNITIDRDPNKSYSDGDVIPGTGGGILGAFKKPDGNILTANEYNKMRFRPGFENRRIDTGPSRGELLTNIIPNLDKFGNYTGDDPLLKDYAAAGRGTASAMLTKLPANHPYADSGAGYYTFNGTVFTKVADENPTPEYMKFLRSQYLPSLAKGGMPTGIMRTNKAGVMERDYRDKGGFVPVGIKEKADDVPAMLSKNEFVFTADAVRGAGNGSIEKGAQRMYDTMKKLEKRVV